jgi:DNA polymerase
MGEAPGYTEVATGKPFVGAAGSMLERIFRRNQLSRNAFRIGNILQCVPPGLELRGAPYEQSAIDHCRVHRELLLNEGHPVVVAMGATPLRTLLNLHGSKDIRVEDFHGTVQREANDRFWVVPTFHPSYLQRGAHNLIGTVSFDLQVALELARGTWEPQPIDLVLDPPLDWFEAWAGGYIAAATADPEGVGLACDLETPDKANGKPENELGPDDQSYQILRFNFSCHPDQGVTVPYEGAYIPIIDRVLACLGWKYWWNGAGYDWTRVAAAGHQLPPEWNLDLMIAAHVLQSDVPLGLGFWAPFYSNYGAWKHLSGSDPTLYACIDGPQTYRTSVGIIGDLVAQGQWRAFHEDCHQLYHSALKPAQDIGILIDQPALETFHEDLATKQRRLLHELQGLVPLELRPLTHETQEPPVVGILHPAARTHTLAGVEKKDQPDPLKQSLYALSATRVERQVTRMIQCCTTCGAEDVHKKHRCKDAAGKINKDAVAAITLVEKLVVRWFWQEPFNPDSPQQILAYLKLKGHKPGKDKHTKKDSANRDTLLRLAKSTKDPFYQINLDYRAVKKVDSTYAVPTLRRVQKDPEGRLHPIPTFRPSTMRLSYVAPNITNVVTDKGGKASLASGFRRCVVAGPGCRLLEVDYAGIEAVETGWFSRDPNYIRLAKLGVHAYLASHLLGRPADLGWTDGDLAAYFKEIKATAGIIYDKAKRCVHGTAYGLTDFGMSETYPDLFKDVKDAAKVQAILFEVLPTLPVWHHALQQRAYDAGCLGGAGEVMMTPDNRCYARDWIDKGGASPWPHPFQYKHWFWSVLAYKPITEKQRQWRQKRGRLSVEINGRWFAVDRGEDANRVIAFYPQSTARGVLTRPMRALFGDPDHPSYIGDQYYGRSPFRAPIHDSLLLEVPDRAWDRVCEKVFLEMRRPIAEQPLPAEWNMGSHLSIGIDAKAGRNWLDSEGIKVPGLEELGLRGDDAYRAIEEADQEDFNEMETVA